MLFKHFVFILFLLFVEICFATESVLPPDPPPSEVTGPPPPLIIERTWEQRLIESNITISEWFDGVTEGLDLFLTGKKVTERKNDSRFRIDNSTYSREGTSIENTTSISVVPRLPNLEEYLQLKFATYDERTDTRGVQSGYLRQSPREKTYGATVGVFRKLGNIRTAFQPRIELQDPLKVSHSLAFESVADLKTYEINPKIEFYANDGGAGLFQRLNFNFRLNQIYSLVFINEGDYNDKKHRFSVTNGVSLGQYVTERSALTYGVLFNSLNRESYHLEGYSFSVAWNQMIYKNILDYQLTPHWDFEKDNQFKGRLGLAFTVSLIF